MPIRFLDLFAGAGGLSEGFVQAGFEPIAHVEMDKAACYTLQTRVAYHHLKGTAEGRQLYARYLRGEMSRNELYALIPPDKLRSVIQATIGSDTINGVFDKINELKGSHSVDLIVGGPPCQAYSIAGRSRKGKDEIKTDPKNYLFKYYVDFLKEYQPKCFIFENVLGLETACDVHGVFFKQMMLEDFKKAGYRVKIHSYEAEQYGVPQRRRRLILVGKRGSDDFEYPEASKEGLTTTISELLYDLKRLQTGEGGVMENGRATRPAKWLSEHQIADEFYPITYHKARYHNDRDKEIYRQAVTMWDSEKRRLNYAYDVRDELRTHKNVGSFTDRYKVVEGNDYACHTIVAHISKDGHYYIHPDITQNRSLTPREAARLQTFPDNYFFESPSDRKRSLSYAFRQIGNAVPVLLARRIAEALKKDFFGC